MRKAIKVQNFLSSREQNVFTTCAGIVWTKIKSIVLNGTQMSLKARMETNAWRQLVLKGWAT